MYNSNTPFGLLPESKNVPPKWLDCARKLQIPHILNIMGREPAPTGEMFGLNLVGG
jgi:hypothetical protein